MQLKVFIFLLSPEVAVSQKKMVFAMRNVFCNVLRTRGKEIGAKLKAIFAQEV